jgi:hypothetical protein
MGRAFVRDFSGLKGPGVVTSLGVDGLEPKSVLPLLGVPGREREPDLTPHPGRLPGVVGRELSFRGIRL